MSPRAPIACTLSEADRPARRAEMATIAPAASSSRPRRMQTRISMRFRPAAGTRERLAAFVAAESRCCAFLRMQVRDDPDALTLTIDGPAGCEPVMGEMVAAFAP